LSVIELACVVGLAIPLIYKPLAILAPIAAVVIASAIVMHAGTGPETLGYPAPGLAGFVVAGVLGIGLAIGILKSGRLFGHQAAFFSRLLMDPVRLVVHQPQQSDAIVTLSDLSELLFDQVAGVLRQHAFQRVLVDAKRGGFSTFDLPDHHFVGVACQRIRDSHPASVKGRDRCPV
jgi:hypothetical protein